MTTEISKEAARWHLWEASDQQEKEPPYPLEWMTEQDRSEHMELPTFALVESALDVSAPLSEVIELVREMYEAQVERRKRDGDGCYPAPCWRT
jgi:hypothetical protein